MRRHERTCATRNDYFAAVAHSSPPNWAAIVLACPKAGSLESSWREEDSTAMLSLQLF